MTEGDTGGENGGRRTSNVSPDICRDPTATDCRFPGKGFWVCDLGFI